MISLSRALRAACCDLSAADFRDLVQEVRAVFCPCWTGEELTLHPRQALAYCREVRRRLGNPRLADHLILRTLTNVRKHPPVIG
jgi:hypothetical protein